MRSSEKWVHEPLGPDPARTDLRRSRGSTTERGYGHRHQLIRRIHLGREPLCRLCQRPATVSDHIKPIRDGGDPWSLANRQALCRKCHNEKTKSDIESRKNESIKWRMSI